MRVSNSSVQIRPDVQTVCKGCQQTTSIGRVTSTFTVPREGGVKFYEYFNPLSQVMFTCIVQL